MEIDIINDKMILCTMRLIIYLAYQIIIIKNVLPFLMHPKDSRHIKFAPSVRPGFCVRTITLYCMTIFQYNLAEVFDISRRWVLRRMYAHMAKVIVTA